MRKLAIQLENETFTPGEKIEGHVIVTCDNDFQCERIHISLKGTELARVVIHAGKVTIVHEEKREHISKTENLADCLTIPQGDSLYDFSFTLPSNIPGSYVGTYGSIKYTLQAIAEISWARDLKSEVDLFVPFTTNLETDTVQSPKTGTIEIDGITILKVQIDEDHLSPGDSLSFRFSVDRTAKIRGVRADLIRLEHVEPKGHRMNTKRMIAEEYYPDKEIVRDFWTDATILTNSRWTPSFSSELITCHYLLKITLDIPLRLDSVIEIPIILGSSGINDDSAFDL
ncbi:MAG: hypothetical protein E4H14_10815 [Candidatus Thorarchaeota archaeon]|nr:MAG: hypothetical protein E4H14_10815 [Candidatus Thorarchaeota archaeon]